MPDQMTGFLAPSSAVTASFTAPRAGAWAMRFGDWYGRPPPALPGVSTSDGISTMHRAGAAVAEDVEGAAHHGEHHVGLPDDLCVPGTLW